ncbi:hypothetical protein [Glycomyces tarimensis]
MRILVVIAVAALLLAGCSQPGTGPESESTNGQEPTSAAEETGPPIDLVDVCDRLVDLSAMPHNHESEYVNAGEAPGNNSVRCSIEPSDWGETAALGEMGRAVLDLKIQNEGALDLQPGEEYESDRPAGDYLTKEFEEHVHGEVARWPDSVNEDDAEQFTGHRYEFWFDAKLPGTWMRHEILFLVPGSDGSELEYYRPIAVDIFKAYMEAIATESE